MNQIIVDNIVKPLIPYIITPQNKSDLIDPFTVIVRLAIVSYKAEGTKISIGNNRITIQPPTLLQGSLRTLNGDKKTDLNILQLPIIYACKTYLMIRESGAMKGIKSGMCRWIFEKAIQGLKNLKSTYDSNEIVYTISHLIDIIQGYLDSKQIMQMDVTKEVEMKEAIFKNLDTTWNDDALSTISLLFTRIDTASNNSRKHYIASLEDFVNGLEEDLAGVYAYIFKK